MTWLLVYHLSTGALLAFFAALPLVNLAWVRRPRGTLPQPAPFVSVLVPARNEERSIEACVRSLLAQDYPAEAFEVVVLDDQSDDATPAILARMARGSRTLRVVRGSGPPPGWVGKPWACWNLSRLASERASWLLFTDADTQHATNALRLAVAEAERDRLDLLSLFPRQVTGSWPERLAVPLLFHQIIGYLPLPAMERWPAPALAAANGQYMLFRRATYLRIGGHAATARTIAEDVGLARIIKAWGDRVRLSDGTGLVACRMYQGGREMIEGFTRSFAAGFHVSAPISLGLVVCNLFLFWAPFVWLPVGLLLRAAWWPLVAAQALLILGLRLLLAWRAHDRLVDALWHPAGMALLIGIQLRAIYNAFIRRRSVWKGRVYALSDGS